MTNIKSLQLFLIILTISVISCHHLSYDIECRFLNNRWILTGPVYVCDVTNNLIVTEREIGISSMKGVHVDGKTSSDVSAVWITLRTVNFLPDFTPTTTKIVAFGIQSCRVYKLRQRDLIPYPKLVHLNLWGNYIKYLEKDVFKFNPDLKYIDFTNNKLVKIDPTVFEPLKSLEVLKLNNNDCLKDAGNDQLSVDKWTFWIHEKCQNFPEPVRARPREEYKRHVREKTSIWVTFGVTFATFSSTAVVLVIFYHLKKFFLP